ncbi:FkbM family methyltransferase [Thermodesulfobacteriota bacterium]
MDIQQSISIHDLKEENEKEQIRKYFNYKKNGVCVEVGSNEPISVCSQSWHLEDKLDWKCVLIEPNPDLFVKTKNIRPKTTIHNCACVSDEQTDYVELHIPLSDKGESITGHASLEKNIDEHNYKRHKSIKVKANTLNHILKQDRIKIIDLLSIDVEGAELEVLKGIDFQCFRPKLILLEDKHLYLAKHKYLKNEGYDLVQRLNRNCWYIPKGETIPEVKIIDKIMLMKRLYLSVWFNKAKYSLRHRTLKPFKTL